MSRAASLQASLLAGGLRADTPVIAVENASRPDTRCVSATVASMVDEFARQQLKSPAVLIVGDAMQARALALADRGLSVSYEPPSYEPRQNRA